MGRWLVLAWLAVAFPAWGQGAEAVNRANNGTVGVIAGGVDGTYIRIAADLAAVLDDGEKLRVLALLGRGSVQNILDIVMLRGIDIGIVQSDVLAYARMDRRLPGVGNAVQYIAKLYDEEVHVLAGRGVASVADLAGKRVNVDVRGSGTAMTAGLMFGMLGVSVEPVHDDQATALEKLKNGEIAAMVYVAGKPARLFSGLDPALGLHFLPVPMTPALLETYLPAVLGAEAYPGLVPAGGEVQTIAVGAVMAVFAWPAGHDRYRRVAAFVDAFFDKFEAFRRAPRHPKWREVNIAARLPGWTRFPAAQAWLDRRGVRQ